LTEQEYEEKVEKLKDIEKEVDALEEKVKKGKKLGKSSIKEQ